MSLKAGEALPPPVAFGGSIVAGIFTTFVFGLATGLGYLAFSHDAEVVLRSFLPEKADPLALPMAAMCVHALDPATLALSNHPAEKCISSC